MKVVKSKHFKLIDQDIKNNHLDNWYKTENLLTHTHNVNLYLKLEYQNTTQRIKA